MGVQSSKDVQDFHGVMDADSEPRRIDTENSGDYIMLRNARPWRKRVEDIEGNILIDNPFLSYAGEYKTVGRFEDIKGQSIIYQVWNSLGYHSIFRYFLNRPGFPDGQIELVWQVRNPSIYTNYNKNPLNFHPDFLCEGINLVDNLLLWTNFYDEPKQMDIVRANETNKRRKFDFYINQNELTNSIAYTFTLYNFLGVVISTNTFTSSDAQLSDRVQSITNDINNSINIGYRAINKTNYIEIELSSVGRYELTLSDTGTYHSRVLANNFYNSDVPGNFFNRIQAPPMCRPDAYYIPAGPPTEDDQISAILNTLSNADSGTINQDTPTAPPPYKRIWGIGVGAEVNDLLNNVVLGGTFSKQENYNANPFQNVTYADVQGFVRTNNGSLTMDIGFDISVTWQPFVIRNTLPNGQFAYILMSAECLVYLLKITPSNVVSIVGGAAVPITPLSSGTYTVSPVFNQVNVIGPASDKYFIAIIGLGVTDLDFTNGYINLGSVAIGGTTESIIKQTNMFRQKYIWENYQHSVYGQASSVVLRTEGYRSQFQVQINFNDKFIASDDYCSRLKKIVCSYTKDGGKTWYDFDTLYPYQFVLEGSRYVIFDGKKTSLTVAPTVASLQFSATPLKSRSQEYIDERIFDGGIVEGYNTQIVDFDVLLNVDDYKDNPYYALGVLPISVEGFKPGYSGYIGIVYYDDFDRKSPVCLCQNSKIQIPYYPAPMEAGDNFNSVMPVWSIFVNIFNEPPEWATKFRLVRTKDFTQSSYLMWVINTYQAVNQDGTAGGTPKYFEINLDNIPYYTDKAQRGAVIEYTYKVGDRIKIITNTSGVILAEVHDLEIKAANTNSIYIDYDPTLPINIGALIEIYSKAEITTPEDSLFYEMGECGEVKAAFFGGILKKYHTGNNPLEAFPDQSYSFGGATTPAKLKSNHGGVYNRIRTMYGNVPAAVDDKNYWINSNYADEFESSKEDGLTRPNGVLSIGQVEVFSAIRFTNKFLSGTEINGLNVNEPLNAVNYTTSYGLIEKMQVVNNDILKLIFGNSYQLSLYISQGIINQAQGMATIVSISDEVAGNSHLIHRTMGTTNGESVTLNDEGDVFGWDENKGLVWRSSGNGLIQVSDNKQKITFKNFSNARKLLDVPRSQCPSIYDLYHDQYILTLGRLTPKPERPATAILDIIDVGRTGIGSITVFIEQTGEVIVPVQAPLITTTVNDFVAAAFVNVGWTAITNSNGTISLYAPPGYNNQSIVVQIETIQKQYGKELIRNGSFIPPNTIYNWIGTFGWDINPTPGFPYASYQQLGSTNNPITQEGLELEVGATYRLIYDAVVNNGRVQSVLGSGVGASPGTPLDATTIDFEEELVFNTPLFPVIQLVPALNTLGNISNFAGYITNVRLSKVLGNNFTLKFQITGYEPAATGETFEPVTYMFAKGRNGWTNTAEFTPELYGRLNDNIVSFVGGKLWLHTQNAIPKNFYGVQYARSLTLAVNKSFPTRKVFKGISINGIGVNGAPLLKIYPYEGFPLGMESELTPSHFVLQEGIQTAAIQMDKLTPGFTDPNKAWVNGREMRGEVMSVELVNNLPEFSVIYSVEILYFYSENT